MSNDSGTMRAVGFHEHGSIDNLELLEVPTPDIRRDGVLVDVKATSLNHHDVFTIRELEDQPDDYPYWLGMDFAGEIAAVGDEVEGWSVGDKVLMAWGGYGAWRTGAFCEYVDAKPDDLVAIPDAVDYSTAASLPVAGGTAYKALMQTGGLQGDDDFLMVGGTGGVGTFAIQIANAVANVDTLYATTSSETKAEFLRDLGADHVIDYTEESFDRMIWDLTDKQGVDIVYDCVGGDSWTKSMRSLKRSGGGRLINSGATAGPNPRTEIRLIFQREIKINGSDGWTTEGIESLLRYVDEGTIDPVIQSTHPLEEYDVAFEKMVNRELIGKVLLVQD